MWNFLVNTAFHAPHPLALFFFSYLGTVMPELNLLRFLPLLLFQVHKVKDLDLVLDLKKQADLDQVCVKIELYPLPLTSFCHLSVQKSKHLGYTNLKLFQARGMKI